MMLVAAKWFAGQSENESESAMQLALRKISAACLLACLLSADVDGSDGQVDGKWR